MTVDVGLIGAGTRCRDQRQPQQSSREAPIRTGCANRSNRRQSRRDVTIDDDIKSYKSERYPATDALVASGSVVVTLGSVLRNTGSAIDPER
jgi:hypothetical protein